MADEHSTEDGWEAPVLNGNRHDYLLRKSQNLDLYMCEGCKEMGLNSGYESSATNPNSRKRCNFHVHCFTLKDEEQHPILTHKKFSFRRRTFSSHRCTACAHKLKGFVYENRDMRLHPLCLMLPLEFEYDGKSFRLTIGEWKAFDCCYCKETIKYGWKYMSKDDCMGVPCAKSHLHGLSAKGILSSPVRRHRDDFQNVLDYTLRCVASIADVAGVVGIVQGCLGG